MEHLLLNISTVRGYDVVEGKPSQHKIPVALTQDGRVIFGDRRTPASVHAKGLISYDDEYERQRRLLAETVLAEMALATPRYVDRAVRKVSRGIRTYWEAKKIQFIDKNFSDVLDNSTRYLYGASSFGRRSEVVPDSGNILAVKSLIEGWFATLIADPLDLPKVMNLQDHFGRVLFDRLLGPSDRPIGEKEAWKTSAEHIRYQTALSQYRPEWYDDRNLRGRIDLSQFREGRDKKKPPKILDSKLPGLITEDFTLPLTAVKGSISRCGHDFETMKRETRRRGYDHNLIDAQKLQSDFRQMLGDYNLPFSASASGTTSTLLASARLFASISDSEDLKQYVLACIAYLVGGGMHTCHEVFVTGNLAGVPYKTGKYHDSLPASLTSSREYEYWFQEFYEIVRTDRDKVA